MEIEQKSKISLFFLLIFWSWATITTTVIVAPTAAGLSFYDHFSILVQMIQNDQNKKGNAHQGMKSEMLNFRNCL